MSNEKTPRASERRSRLSLVHKGFKSPLISRESASHNQAPTAGDASSAEQQSYTQTLQDQRAKSVGEVERLQNDVSKLKQEVKDVQEEIEKLKNSGIEESELAEYISKLHEYNDLKDIAQMIIGNIASIRGVRTRDLYPDYGLELDD